MKRTILVALGVAVIASSAAGFGISAARAPAPMQMQCTQSDTDICRMRVASAARDEQRARVETRYEADRAKCAPLSGAQKDSCLISAHAARGRALLEAAAPYERRS